MPEPDALPLEHLSASSVALYADCSRAWQARYVERRPSGGAPALIFGSAWDTMLERYFRAVIAGTPQPPLRHTWETAWQEQVARARDDDWQGAVPEALENTGAKLAASDETRTVLAGIRPLVGADGAPALQRRVSLRVPGVPIPAIGFLDIITADGLPGDFKTAARAWPADKPRKDLQPRLYLAALLQERWPLSSLRFRHWIWIKGTRPSVQLLDTEYTLTEIAHAVETIRAAWHGIQSRVFVPNPSSWRCNTGCEAWAACQGRR